MTTKIENVSRRNFLKNSAIGAGSLVLATGLPGFNLAMAAFPSPIEGAGVLNLFVAIEADNRVRIVCHRSEMGQGIRTGIPQVLADELDVDWSMVDVVQGFANPGYGSQNTDGSRSIRRFFTTMRQMGASARMMLEQAAAEKWGVPVDQVRGKQGYVHHVSSDRKLSYGELASAAAKLTPPQTDSLVLKPASEFTLIGKGLAPVDIDDMLDGSAVYGQDVQLEGMLYASIERCPVVGQKVKSHDKAGAMKVNGVRDVMVMPEQPDAPAFHPLNGVAVLADNTWSALQGRKALKVEWSDSLHQQHDSANYMSTLVERVGQPGKVIRTRGDVKGAFDGADAVVKATYQVPYLVHAQMEPPAATAVVSEKHCEIWACTQTPQSTQQNVAQALGLQPEQVKVNVTLLGGGFGRKSKPDFSVEAALLARHTGKPVKVVWSREDDIQHGYYHAASAQRFEAAVNKDGSVVGWLQRTAFPSISWTFTGTVDEPQDGELSLGFGDVPFAVNAMQCESQKAEGHVRIGWMRSVSNIQHAFAQGAFVDEMAAATGKTPHAMWHALLGEDRIVDPTAEGFGYGNYGDPADVYPIDIARMKRVLDEVVKQSGADKSTGDNEGWGISVHRSFVSYVAVACKVRVEQGKVSVLELHSAIDCGTVVNPDRVRSQQEGSMLFGLSIALMGEISLEGGKVKQSNYHDYPVTRYHQSPMIKTYIIASDAPPGGVGEPGTPPVAASVVNAIYHASGRRIRTLPVNKTLSV
ncbi:molybdopterin-dependent oxidoreductase [Aestuariibacter halophilus]|uniref:Molybdopterin-dependent oxidoreductase n=1 Tax=Fluctibacter halophilus TaxID=226011 RepID=A0ABS8G4Z5_9ALTE|nr:molybdopterin cofactor-binding domain-containing protein [Aestuariibacter halophilus]MCC2615620.1 molybdopterin-dependent oxidoreductase [Aestuariibacter halophilus]